MSEPTVIERQTDEVQEHAAAEQCCEPECGPDTCGGPAGTQDVRIEDVSAAAEQCCEPECGPDTCGG